MNSDHGPGRTERRTLSTQSRTRQRDRRTTAVVTVVLSVALCVAGVVFAVRELSSVGEGSVAASPATPTPTSKGAPPEAAVVEPRVETEATVEPEPEAEPEVEVTAFSSPTGNIGCLISVEGARCDIADRSWDPGAPPPECEQTWGQGVAVGDAGAALVCAGDTAIGGSPALAYGEAVIAEPFRCTSSETGMQCENTSTGSGFALSRESYRTF